MTRRHLPTLAEIEQAELAELIKVFEGEWRGPGPVHPSGVAHLDTKPGIVTFNLRGLPEQLAYLLAAVRYYQTGDPGSGVDDPAARAQVSNGAWMALVLGHRRKLTDVSCPQCGEGRCDCLGTLVSVCAECDEDWPCRIVRAFAAGRMSGFQIAAALLERIASLAPDDDPDDPIARLLRDTAATLLEQAAQIDRRVAAEIDPAEEGEPTFLEQRAATDPSLDHASHSQQWSGGGPCPECPSDLASPATVTPLKRRT